MRLAFCLLLNAAAILAQSLCVAGDPVSFTRDIRPILSDACFACHGPDEDKREADLRLDVAEIALESGAVSPGDVDASELWNRINSDDPSERMPPEESHRKLTETERELVRRWIESGAKYEQHWSFVAAVKPEVPDNEADHPIDAFLRRRLQSEGLSPAPLADRRTLIRRVTLDLTGLPPTLDEIETFLGDESDDAYERLIGRLMGRVSYGQQMARYWLDLARYADTHGLHLDNERSMWPYRDWVVRAFHENVPFDDFTRWQLAGDLLENPTRDQLIASGFNRCNVTSSEGGSISEELIYRYAVDRTSTTSEVWMGLTAGCAVCHDHKFDPISTREYYSMYAFFHSAADPAMDGNRIDTPPILRLYAEGDEARLLQLDEELATLADETKAKLAGLRYVDPATVDPPPIQSTVDTATDPTWSWQVWKNQNTKKRVDELPAALRQLVQSKHPDDWSNEQARRVHDYWLEHFYAGAAETFADIKARRTALEEQKAEIEKVTPITFVMADLPEPRESFVMLRGAYDQPGEKVSRAVPAFLPALPGRPKDRDYNRLDFANWLVSGEHPLTARVAVNRFWQQFFGTGIVKTSGDFGSQGDPPSHPELLDWLAVDFVEQGWDVKGLVELILTSHAYRQSSKVTPEAWRLDPENRLLARAPRLRLDAEVLRDQALFVSGLLVDDVGGKAVKPYQPPNIWEPVGFGNSNTRYYKQDTGDALYRRSLYTFLKRTAPPPFMTTFDAPNREQSCTSRLRSNTPLQALQMMNDIQHVEAARHFASQIIRKGGDHPTDRIRWAWTVITGRPPTGAEIAVAAEALATHLQRYAKDPNSAMQLILYGDSKPDGSLDAGQLAAYTMLTNLLLNLDETVTRN